MEIILQGKLNQTEATVSLKSVLELLHNRYHIAAFREMHLHLTLLDEAGNEVELVDSNTNEVYRVFEVRQKSPELSERPVSTAPHLVVDNTKPKKN